MANNKIGSYRASYGVNYYEVGNVYDFFARKAISQPETSPKVAPDDTIAKYAQALQGLEEDTDPDFIGRAHLNFTHFYGVVVDIVKNKKKVMKNEEIKKIKVKKVWNNSKIIVMFHQNSSNGAPPYVLKTYAVGHKGIWNDGKSIPGVKASINPNPLTYSQSDLSKRYAAVPVDKQQTQKVKPKQMRLNRKLRMRGLSPRLKRKHFSRIHYTDGKTKKSIHNRY